MIDFFGLKRKKTETGVLLDIGTETVKALLFEKRGQKIDILASSFEYFDRYGVFESRDFEKDITEKAVFRAFQKLGVDSKSVLLGLPAEIFKARVVYQNLKRSHPKEIIGRDEEKEIYHKAIDEAKRNISQSFSRQSGILPADIHFVNLKILEIKIDGYKVKNLQKYDGCNLGFRILATFLPNNYLGKIETIIKSAGLRIEKIVHQAEGLGLYFNEKNDKIFVDIGGTITQIFFVRAGVLAAADEFLIGGQFFSKAISEKLGLRDVSARTLKERYSKKELTKESSDRIKEILRFACQTWFENLKLKLKEMAGGYFPALDIVLFGGGSQLPDIKDILKSGEWKKISFNADISLKFLDNPQEAPLLLMAYSQC